VDTSPIGLKKNWVTDAGGLPLYIRAVAHAFIRKGVPESRAIQRAVGVVQDWARGSDGKGGHVTPATMAKAAAAVADWEKLKAKVKAHDHANDSPAIDLAFREPERVPPGRPEGGQFATRPPVLTSSDTPQQTAQAINAMEDGQRAGCRRSMMPPPGYTWQSGDHLAEAT
jgi:hypothetical protein